MIWTQGGELWANDTKLVWAKSIFWAQTSFGLSGDFWPLVELESISVLENSALILEATTM